MPYTDYNTYKAHIKTKISSDIPDNVVDWVLTYVFSIVPFKESRKEYCNGNGTPKLFLKYLPIDRDIPTTIKVDWEDFTDFQVVSGQGFLFLSSGIRPRGYENIEVTYTAWYNPIPLDVEQAIIELIDFQYNQSKTAGISSEAIDDYRVVFDKTAPQSINNVLSQYKTYNV